MPEEPGPILILGKRLRSAMPPSISSLINRLRSNEEFLEFVRIVREFLPEREQEIFANAEPRDQVAVFASRFEDRYFPLPEILIESFEQLSDITRGVPIELLGLDWDDYHEIPTNSWSLGIQLMTYVLEEIEEDILSSLADACAKVVPRHLLERRLDDGLKVADAVRILEGTDYEGLATWGRVLEHNTGTIFFDITIEELGYQNLSWEKELVEELTRQWAQAQQIFDRSMNLAIWLEESPADHFKELLDAIDKGLEGRPVKHEHEGEQLRFILDDGDRPIITV